METRASNGVIGIFDSGVGGLSVLRALWEQLPQERFYYVADSHHCPYADRTPAEIESLSLGIADHLLTAGAKAIVVACNTASASALPALRQHLGDLPVVGMVPALKTAASLTRQGTVGVLATQATLEGYLFREVRERYAARIQVLSLACPGLVEQIEAGRTATPDTEALLRACLAPMQAARADVLVLGCTHYPFVLPLLQRVLGPDVLLLEPSDAVARQTRRVLQERGLAANETANHQRDTVFATTGEPAAFQRVLQQLMGVNSPVVRLAWERGQLLRTEPTTIQWHASRKKVL